MKRLGHRHSKHPAPRRRLSQIVAGLLALPLSAVPFVAYANLTPEGRLVRDRMSVALRPPSLPVLTPLQVAAAVERAPRYRGAVMALAYHGIGSSSDAEGGFVISPERFGEHLATLRAAGMNTVTAAQVARAFGGGSPLPPNAVMLSFDDGRTDAMLFADPLLEQARMAATMFVITGAASEPGVYYASWDRLKAYARSGRWDIQSHTAQLHREQKVAGGKSLPALTSVVRGESPSAYRARVRTDLAAASSTIERNIGRRPVAFAYPFGAYGAERTNSRAIRGILREEVSRRYQVAFHQDDQETIPLLDGDDDRLGLRRLEVEDWSGVELLRRISRAARIADAADAAGEGGATSTEAVPPGPGSVAEVAGPPTTEPAAVPVPPAPRLATSGATAPRASPTRRTAPRPGSVTTAVPVPTITTASPEVAPPTTEVPLPTTTPPPPTTAPPPTTTPTTAPAPVTTTPTTPPTPDPADPPVCKERGKGPRACPS